METLVDGLLLELKYFFLATIISLFHVIPVSALELNIKNYNGSSVLAAEGDVVKGDSIRLRQQLKKNEYIQEVLFNSNGGNALEAIKIGKVLREFGSVTRIPRNGICASACVYSFLGGVVRFVDRDAKVGVHMHSIIRNDSAVNKLKQLLTGDKREADIRLRLMIAIIEKNSAKMTAKMADYLVKMGISLRLLVPNLETNHWDIYWLNRQELRRYNVVNTD